MKCFNYFQYLLLMLAVISWPIRGAECSSEPLSCLDILKELDSIQKSFDQCCFNLNSCLDTVLTEVNALPGPCDQRIFIDQDFINSATPQITQANTTYCLVESVTGLLIVDADNVIIEMNGHSMDGTASSNVIGVTGHTGFVLRGSGVIRGGSPNGVLLTTCTNVKIEGVNFEENTTALRLNNVQGFSIDTCNFYNNVDNVSPTAVVALALSNSSNGKINDCFMYENRALFLSTNPAVVFVDSCSNVNIFNVHFSYNRAKVILKIEKSNNCVVQNCTANNNSDVAQFVFFASSSSDCFFINCDVIKNLGQSNMAAFRTASLCQKIVFDKCRAIDNTGFGFLLSESPLYCCVLNSIAQGHDSSGFHLVGLTNRNCFAFNNIAIDNGTGFLTLAGNTNVFFSNYAEDNTTNYDTVTPVIRFDTSVGEFRDPVNNCDNVSPSDWDNIAVEPCPQP